MPTLQPLSTEALVNTVTASDQTPAALATLQGGGVAAAFLDESSGASAAKLRLFGADGAAAGGEIVLGSASEVQVASLGAGGFAATWIERAGDHSIVHAEVFDAAGHAVGAVQDLATYREVIDLAAGQPNSSHPLGLHMTALTTGGYAVAWTVQGADSMSFKTMATELVTTDAGGAVLNASGHTIAAGSKSILLYDAHATPVELADGQLMLTWSQQPVNPPASGDPFGGQHLQLYDLTGANAGADLRLDPTPPLGVGPPVDGSQGLAGTALGDGRVAFAWVQSGHVELSLYPEDKLGAGINDGRTVPQVVGDAEGGVPQVVALAGGGFAVVWSGAGTGADLMVRLYAEDGSPQGAATQIGDIAAGDQDLPFGTALGNGLALLWRDASHVAATGGADASGAGVMMQLFTSAGGEGPHIAYAGPGEVLAGGPGIDWLVAQGGGDTLTGGGGADAFVLVEGGAPDRVLDFHHGQDALQLFAPDGTIAPGAQGILSFSAADHTLSWAPGGDSGAAGRQTLAVLDGVTSLGRSDLAAGFRPAVLQVLNADGSLEQTQFDWGSAAWDRVVVDRDPAGRASSYQVVMDDGSHSTTWFDAASSEPWAAREADWDSTGALLQYTVRFDDGHVTQFTLDPHDIHPWAWVHDEYDAARHLTLRGVVGDDGVGVETTFGPAELPAGTVVG
jgi:hypothetical protein